MSDFFWPGRLHGFTPQGDASQAESLLAGRNDTPSWVLHWPVCVKPAMMVLRVRPPSFLWKDVALNLSQSFWSMLLCGGNAPSCCEFARHLFVDFPGNIFCRSRRQFSLSESDWVGMRKMNGLCSGCWDWNSFRVFRMAGSRRNQCFVRRFRQPHCLVSVSRSFASHHACLQHGRSADWFWRGLTVDSLFRGLV